ncbi:hypothetical protein E2C01_031235 [Portunus trituberculatus]|uniref:Uncharacterized protein n=1 Tax=Portunus trituberculatus TaxID=210409 RepID=A0A5B7EWB9_PORTR|nr:hypothetical protein [Portunus trituberculatus]
MASERKPKKNEMIKDHTAVFSLVLQVQCLGGALKKELWGLGILVGFSVYNMSVVRVTEEHQWWQRRDGEMKCCINHRRGRQRPLASSLLQRPAVRQEHRLDHHSKGQISLDFGTFS